MRSPEIEVVEQETLLKTIQVRLAVMHDKDGTPDLKFVHEDGREAVYHKDTKELVTEPHCKGTYNYVVP